MNLPLSLRVAALLLTAHGCLAAWHGVAPSLFILALPLTAWALLRRNRAVWLTAGVFVFLMAAFCAAIAWKAASRPDTPAWFLSHFRWTGLFWLAVAALLSAPSTRRVMARRM